MNTDIHIGSYNAVRRYTIVYFRHADTTIQQMHSNESISLSSADICLAATGPEGAFAAPMHLSSNSLPPSFAKDVQGSQAPASGRDEQDHFDGLQLS